MVMPLVLDVGKVRKGKPVGLPYQGSKKKIAKQIVEIIKQNFGTDKPVYDVFGGGGAITCECLINGLNVHYNDACPISGAMLKRVVEQNRDWLKTLIISRAEFLAIRELEHKTVDDELKLLVNSFGNNRRNYLYNKDIADLKYRAAVEIVRNHDVFSGYQKTETYKQLKLGRLQLEQFQRMQQLERLQQLHQLHQLQQLHQLEYTADDYRAFSNVKGAVIYCDPPYEGTDTKGYSQKTFDSQAFYDWAFEMAKHNIVLISSYTVADKRFTPVFEFEKARSTYNDKAAGKHTEKLFMAKAV